MEIEDVKRDRRKKVVMSIRTTEEISEFMKEHDISPSRVFEKAIEGLIEEVEGKEDD
jgi:uncharacterized protein (DUF302 family)